MCSRFSFYCVNVKFLLYGWVECLSFIDIRLSKYSLKPWTSPCGRKAPGWSRRQCVFDCSDVRLQCCCWWWWWWWCVMLTAGLWLETGPGFREEGGGRREAAQIWSRLPLHTYDSHTPSTIHQSLSISHTIVSYNTILPCTYHLPSNSTSLYHYIMQHCTIRHYNYTIIHAPLNHTPTSPTIHQRAIKHIPTFDASSNI